MSMPQTQTRFTVDQYLAFERAADERHIYLDGDVFAMAGESPAHGDINVNLILTLGTPLKGKPCRISTQNTKVRSGIGLMAGHSTKGMFSYPDIVAICGERQFHDSHRDIILNPKAIFEVLSTSTEGFDRGEKFIRYRSWNPTLTDYVLVSQDKPHVEHHVKQADGAWLCRDYHGLEASFEIASIGCTLKLADVYDEVQFPPTADNGRDENGEDTKGL
jgi:Uma2 family endonuclease